MTRGRSHHPSISAGLYCLTTSPGFLSYTRDRRLTISSDRLGNEDKAPCPRAILQGQGSNWGPLVWKSEVLTARPQQLLYFSTANNSCCCRQKFGVSPKKNWYQNKPGYHKHSIQSSYCSKTRSSNEKKKKAVWGMKLGMGLL